jgi:hypothetical protein
MPSIVIKTVARVSLDAKEECLMWNWLLARQGLSNDTKFITTLGVVSASLGLHAARLQSPFATVLARAESPSVAAELFTSKCRSSLITVRCMRKTLHTLPIQMAAIAHAATVHFRERDALRAIENAGMLRCDIEGMMEDVEDLLSKTGPLFHRHIEKRLCDQQHPVQGVRLAIKLAWEIGRLVYLNNSAGWNRENRQFALPSDAYPGLEMNLDKQKATADLIEIYFDRYGPASIRDSVWWSGLSSSAIASGLQSIRREVIELHTSWTGSPLYMFRDRFEEFRDEVKKGHDIYNLTLNFLAHEDVALKAYFESRNRYMDGIPLDAAFNQIGEALPTILLGGRVVGVWGWNRRSMRVEWSTISNRIPYSLRKGVKDRAEAISVAFRQWVVPREASTNLVLDFGEASSG